MPATKIKRRDTLQRLRKKPIEKSDTKSFLVYVPDSLLKKMDERWKEEGFLSRSEMARKILTEAME